MTMPERNRGSRVSLSTNNLKKIETDNYTAYSGLFYEKMNPLAGKSAKARIVQVIPAKVRISLVQID